MLVAIFQRFLLILGFCGIFVQALSAQSPKREFRGVWVATVANIDWPSEPGLSTYEQQHEILDIVDMHKKNGINAIILQVRPTADALYSSELEPWSGFLTGEQGKAPDPFYDPLEFWIREAHKRGMELHAWFNPYRINVDTADFLSGSHIIHKHPEWLFSYGGRFYFSPANPGVWNFVREVVVDVVRRYDVDAIHFDDYFYPYRIENQEFPDSLDFARYGGKFYPDRLEEWRRHNVDTIIAMLGAAIKEEKPWVKFGISPFGVWRNRSEDERGSETTAGTSNYDGLYADVLLWQQKGWIDYLMPQLYWRE
ncbi:MAG: family 10 glycosylhydrolase, partial [Bacteroidales bacterium]|nr:family 10 glycosylhydrolase [Bacteroidales bacterium]